MSIDNPEGPDHGYRDGEIPEEPALGESPDAQARYAELQRTCLAELKALVARLELLLAVEHAGGARCPVPYREIEKMRKLAAEWERSTWNNPPGPESTD